MAVKKNSSCVLLQDIASGSQTITTITRTQVHVHTTMKQTTTSSQTLIMVKSTLHEHTYTQAVHVYEHVGDILDSC